GLRRGLPSAPVVVSNFAMCKVGSSDDSSCSRYFFTVWGLTRTSFAITLFDRTGHADFLHPALGQDFTPSPTARCGQAGSDVRVRSARIGARVDRSRPCVA